ncbi:MAG: hypothetical protein JSU87_10335 [Gemmatimonadota bacterium]|nr:MAG: hypothetical protein JSU87_10335 [Gemmatimonadota bacterium]
MLKRVKIVRATVRPDLREEYLGRWRRFAEAAAEVGARASLYEDFVLPGRFVEWVEYEASGATKGRIGEALQGADLRRACVRREGEDVNYREVVLFEQ